MLIRANSCNSWQIFRYFWNTKQALLVGQFEGIEKIYAGFDPYTDSISPCPCDSFMIKNPDFDRISWIADSLGINGYRARYDENNFSTFDTKLFFENFDYECLKYYLGNSYYNKYCNSNLATYPLSVSFEDKTIKDDTIIFIYKFNRQEHRLRLYSSKSGRIYTFERALEPIVEFFTSNPPDIDWDTSVFCR